MDVTIIVAVVSATIIEQNRTEQKVYYDLSIKAHHRKTPGNATIIVAVVSATIIERLQGMPQS